MRENQAAAPTVLFGNPKAIAQGWYGALPSRELPKGEKRALKIFGKELVLFRGESGRAYAMEARCPHLGAHLGQGKVEGESIRCGFHGWKFSASSGSCEEVPGAPADFQCSRVPGKQTFSLEEKFGLIWIHTGGAPGKLEKLPIEFEALKGQEVVFWIEPFGPRKCHFTFLLGQGIEETHYLFVHEKTVRPTGAFRFASERISHEVIRFKNVAPIQGDSFKARWFKKINGGVMKSVTTYWNAANALIELGTPSLPLYAVFAYRPTEEGGTEGYNIYLAARGKNPFQKLRALFSLWMVRAILRKGAREEAALNDTLQLTLGAHSFINPPFKTFMEYVEQQRAISLPE